MLTSLRSILLLGLLATLCLGGSIFRSNPLDIQAFQLSAAMDRRCVSTTRRLRLTLSKTKSSLLNFLEIWHQGVWQCESFVTGKTQFQIDSLTKTFIALGIVKLVDEKKLSWNDPVTTHLPWFALTDSMLKNHEGDFVTLDGVYSSEKELVQALGYLDTPKRPFRAGYAYSNMNFIVLAQVLEAVTNQTWYNYLCKTLWVPLVPLTQELSFGHYTCLDKVIGPYNLLNSTIVAVNPKNDYDSSGSMISTADDLSKFSIFLLNKGRGIFSSDAFVSDMITGHVVQTVNPQALSIVTGQTFNPDGGVYAAGYGIDTVGDVMFGQHYFDKGGDMAAFKTRNGFIPAQNLGINVLSNSQWAGGKYSSRMIIYLSRTYVLGIFMDVPIDSLKSNFKKALAALDSNPVTPCDDHYFNGKPIDTGLTIPDNVKTILAGTYHTSSSPKFYGQLELFVKSKDLIFKYGVYSGRVIATPDPSVFALDWDRGAQSNLIQVLGLNESKPQIPLGPSVTFVKD
ncbi:hypothetical protein AC1031_014356 [Aphanomyces cochlioides]|nr:hypothetical protein AC1031_014356 [Aphanomyces cochlioides]